MINYLIFNEDIYFSPETVMKSSVLKQIEDLIFKENFTVLSMTLENR